MRIDEYGGVMIGTYSGTGATRGFIVTPTVNANGYRIRSSVITSSNIAHYQFTNTNGIVGAIRTTGTATAYDTSSDYRLKENVTADWDATTRLKQLNPVRFNFIADADTTVDGFLAHEVQSVVPEAISGTHNEVEVWQDGEELPDGVSVGDNKLDEDGNTIPVYQGIDQSKLVPLLVKTIQELEARITTLENA
jgi:ABC-type transport system substrate-binding protein